MEPVTLEMILSELKKQDLRFDRIEGKMATIEGTMATKDDLTRMATKDDLTRMATKDDLTKMGSEIRKDIASLRDMIAHNHVEITDLKGRVTRLEGPSA